MQNRIIAALLVIIFVLPMGSLAVRAETDSNISYGLLSEGQPVDSLTNIKVVKGYVEINREAPMDNALLLVAKYKGHRLIDLEALNLARESGRVETPVIEVTETGTVIKVMVVEGYETMRPLVEVKEFTKNLILQIAQVKTVTHEDGVVTLTYQQDTALQSITFPSETMLYDNGMPCYGEPKWDNLADKYYGYLEFDQDETGTYNAAYITDYNLLVVKNVDMQAKIITGYFTSTVLNYGKGEGTVDAKLYDGWSDDEQKWEDLQEGDVLVYVREYVGEGNILKAYHIKTPVEGEVERIFNHGTKDAVCQINGKQYRFSSRYSSAGIEEGNKGLFYFDILGNIIYYETYNPAENYGYIIDASVDEVSERVQFYFVKQEVGSYVEKILGVKRLNIDGKFMYDAHAIVDYLTMVCSKYSGYTEQPGQRINVDGNGGTVTQLVKYHLNDAGEIDAIDTVERGSQDQAGKALTVYPRNSSRDWLFSTPGSEFTELDNNSRIRVNSNTYFLFVPENRTDYDEYRVKRFTSNLFKNQERYRIEAYDVNKAYNLAGAFIAYIIHPERHISKETPIALITNCQGRMNSDGEHVKEVTAYILGPDEDGREVKTLYTKDVNTEGIEIGNVIRFVMTKDWKIDTDSVQVLVDVGTGTIDPFTTDEDNKPLAIPSFIDYSVEKYPPGYYYRVAHGLLNYIVEDEQWSFVTMIPVGIRTREAVEAAKNQQYNFITDSATRFYTYDASQPYSNRVTANSYIPLSGYYPYTMEGQESTEESAQRAQELFVYEANGRVRMVYIIKR